MHQIAPSLIWYFNLYREEVGEGLGGGFCGSVNFSLFEESLDFSIFALIPGFILCLVVTADQR